MRVAALVHECFRLRGKFSVMCEYERAGAAKFAVAKCCFITVGESCSKVAPIFFKNQTRGKISARVKT